MPNGDDVKERLRKLKARWKQAIETYPSLLKEFPKEPWDDQGNFDPRALEAYKQAEEKTRYTAPPISTTEPPRQPALTQRQSLPEIKYQATTDAPPPTPSEMGRRLFGLKQADPEQRLGIPGTPISIGPRERSWKTDPSIPIWKGVTKGIDVIQKKGVVPTVSDIIRYLPLKFEPEEGWHRYQTRFGSIPYYPKGETTLSFDQYMTPEGKPSMQAISDLVSRMYPNIGVSGTQAARSILSEALNRADIGGDPTDTERAQRVGEQVRAIEEQEGRVLSQAERREVEEKLYKLPPGGRGLAEELPWAFIPAARVMKGAITGTGLLPRAARGALRPMEILEEAATRGLTKTLDLTSRPFKKFWDLQRGRPSATNISDFLTPQRPPVLPTAPAAARVGATARESIRINVINDLRLGKASTNFMFHASDEVEGIVKKGLKSGGLSTSPIGEQGYGGIIHVFRISDLPPNIKDLGADISFGKGFDPLNPPKPIATFTRKELGGLREGELPLGARAEEQGFLDEPPDEYFWSPEELAEGELLISANERKIINRIEQAYATAARAADVTPATTADNIRLYRGQAQGGQGRYYSTDKNFAREFTQSGQDSEISEIIFPASRIYRSKELPFAKDVDAIDKTLIDARAKGYDAIWVDEGLKQPPSVLFAPARAADVPVTPATAPAADVVPPAARVADEAVPGVVGTARAEIDNIISRVPETSVNTTTQGKRSAAAIVRRNFDELLAGGEVKGQAAKVSYIARQTGRSKEEINGLIGRGPTEPPTVGVGDNFTGDSVDELLATHLTPNFVRRAGEWLAGLPGMKSVVKRVFTPASVARITGNEAVAEGYGYRLLQESQQAIASERLIGFATTKADRMLDRTTRIFDVAREGPEKGKVLLVDGSRRAFGDVAENPAAHRAKGLITAEQEKWITDAHEYIDELARNYQLVSGKQLIFKKKREHYWPRFVVKEDGSVGVSSEKVFARQSPGAPRIYETVEDGMEAGKDYMSDPLEQLTAYSRAVSKMTRDSIFEKRLLSKNIILPDGTPQVMAIRRPRGERVRDLPEWQQRRGLGELDISEAARKQLVQPMGLRRGGFLRIAEMLAAVPKMIVTGLFDTGQFFIQGMPLLFYRKGRWGETVAGSLRTLFSRSPEDYFNHWMRTGYADKIKDASAHGMDVSALSEYYQAAGILGRVPVAGALGRRFGAAFHAYMNVGRVEMYDAMAMVARSKAARSGQSATELERELRRIARIADSIMGGTSTKGLGLSATQRQVENAFLFFAPRYTRSVFGTVSHAAGSGVGAVETRKMLAQMMFGGAAVVAGAVGAIGIAKGKSSEAITKDIEKALDPRSGAAFMSIELGGQYYGIGGGYRAMARLVANVTPGIPGREGRPSPWSRVMEDAAKGKYGDVILRNPIVMFWRSKMAIPTGSLADFIDGEDFIGEEFSLNAFTEDPGRFGRAVMNRTTPFPVQAFIEVLASGSGVGPAVAAGAAEFIGGRQVPVSLVQRREEKEMDLQTSIKDKLDIEGSYEELVDKRGYGDGKAWSTYKDMEESPTRTWELDPKTRLLIARDPEVSELSQRSREETKRWNPELGNYYEEIDLLFNNEDEKNLGLIQQLNKAWSVSTENNDNPGMAYRLARKAIFTKYYTLLQDARSRAEDAGLFRDFDPEGPFAKANDIYNRILFAEDEELIKELVEGSYVPLEPLPGQFNWDEWDRRMNYLVGEFSQEFVNDTKAISREKLPEFERMYRDSVDRISNAGYFDTRDQAAMDLRLSSKWNDYKNLPDGREKERKRDEDIKRIEALGKNKRSRLRLDENLESLLQYWGYETKDVNIDLLKPEGVYIGTYGL